MLSDLILMSKLTTYKSIIAIINKIDLSEFTCFSQQTDKVFLVLFKLFKINSF